MKHFTKNYFNLKWSEKIILKPCLLTFIISMANALPGYAVTYENLDPDTKKIVNRLNIIRQETRSELDSLQDQPMSMTYCPNMCQKSNFPENLQKRRNDLTNLIVDSNIPASKATEWKHVLDEQLFEPLLIKVSPLITFFNDTVTNIQLSPDPATYNTTDLQERFRVFLDNDFSQLFPQSISQCAKFLIPDLEESTAKAMPIVKTEETEQHQQKQQQQKPPLSPEIHTLVKKIGEEFEQRKHLNNNETIMAFGNIVAPQYFHKMQEHELNILELKDKKNLFDNLNEIKDFYLQLKNKGIIKLPAQAEEQMTSALRLTENRFTSDTGIMPRTSLLQAFYILQHLYEKDFDVRSKKEDLQNLLMVSFYTLADQNRSCVYGLVGRIFQIYTEIFSYTVHNYEVTDNNDLL